MALRTLTGRRGALSATAVLLAACLASATTASASHPPGLAPGTPEPQVRAIETELLGEQHAREHALERATPTGEPAFAGALNAGRLSGESGSLVESASLAAAADLDDPRAQTGAWASPFALDLFAIHAATLPTGKVLLFGPPQNGFADNETWGILWDPVTGTQKRVDPPLLRDPSDGLLKPANLYCAGQAFLADGQLLVAGGTLGRSPAVRGLNKLYTFDPWTETWAEQPDMPRGRWYPTQVLLPDGRQVIVSGYDETGTNTINDTVELFNPPATRGGRGSLTMLNGRLGTAGMPPMGDLYPHMFAMPSGKTLVAGPHQNDSWYLNTPGADNNISWLDTPNPSRRRIYGTAVLEPPAPGEVRASTKVVQFGGRTSASTTNHGSTATSEYFDESEASPSWKPGESHQLARTYHNTVLLPDGSMASVGGGVGWPQFEGTEALKQVELWDPVTRTWRLGAAQSETRAYHSVAVLLPDGRVLSAGDNGNAPAGVTDTAEVYEPPYLFKGPRPTISSAPETIQYGQTFGVDTPDTDVQRAVLIAPGATTHATDMHQRYVPVALTGRTGGVNLTAPANANAAPPGYYMLFLVNSAGVPSVAKFVRILPGAEPPPPPPPPPPEKNALLIVANASSVTAGDAGVRTRLQNLGYTVTVRSQTAAASEAAGKDVVVISSTVGSTSVNTKFRSTTVPVVVWEYALFDDMGMTGTASTAFGTLASQTALRVLLPAHPLAAGLSGTPTVTNAAQSFTWGRPGAGAVNVAATTTDSTRSGVFGYESGAQMVGLTAPARRVGLFLVDAGTTRLTADGAKLFDAAIRWADG